MSESSDPIVRGIVLKMHGESEPEADISTHPQPEPPTTEEIDADRLGSVLYAWMMDDPQRGWNIIGMALPTGQYMPMVTSSLEVAWQGFDWAQAHANRYSVRCELVVYERSTTIAIVDPDPPDKTP